MRLDKDVHFIHDGLRAKQRVECDGVARPHRHLPPFLGPAAALSRLAWREPGYQRGGLVRLVAGTGVPAASAPLNTMEGQLGKLAKSKAYVCA